MPRDTLLGLIHSTSKNERITAPIPIPTLNELLGVDAPAALAPQPDVVVRFTPAPSVLAAPNGVHIVERSHWVIAITAVRRLTHSVRASKTRSWIGDTPPVMFSVCHGGSTWNGHTARNRVMSRVAALLLSMR
jgi:hypothetical protein